MSALLASLLIAFLPSTGSLIKRAAARGDGWKGREITFSGTLEADGVSQPAKLVVKLPLSCRLERSDGTTVAVKGTHDKPVATVDGNAGSARTLLELACPLIAYRGLGASGADAALHAVAAQHGADVTAQSSLSRLGDRVVYVLGAGPRELSKPQLWLYKDSSAPARLIAQGGSDLRLLEFGSPAAADWFPRVLELWQDGKRAARFEISETKGARGGDDEEDSGD